MSTNPFTRTTLALGLALMAPLAAWPAVSVSVTIAPPPLPLYAQRRTTFHDVMEEAMRGGDDPATVARVIVRAATDPKPKLRHPAGSTAGRVSVLRRLVPARAFDKSVRKLNRMPS